MAKEKDLIAKIERIRRAGFIRFVLVRGVLFWGVPFGIVMCILILSNFAVPEGIEPPPDLQTKAIPVILAASLIGGALYGTFMWTYYMRLYKKRSH